MVSEPGLGTCFTSKYEVRGCTKCDNGLYSWHNATCRAKSGAEASSPDQRARAYGHELAAAAQPGQWVLIEAFNDDSDEMWFAKTVAFSAFGDAVCCKEHTDGQKNVYGTRFNTGDDSTDHMVARSGTSGSAKAVTASGASSTEAGACLISSIVLSCA